MKKQRKNKRFIIGCLVLASLLLVTGCSENGRKTAADENRKSENGVKESGTGEKQTLTLGVLFEDPRLSDAVAEFNKTQEEVQIEIRQYLSEDVDMQDAVNLIKTEIMAGGGPDLVDFGSDYSPGDASGKILVDLNVLMEQDEQFSKEDYFYNIWDAFADQDGLHVMVPHFTIDTFATSAPELMDLERWDVKTMMESFRARPEGTVLFPGDTKTAVFASFAYGGMANYTDWDSGTCSFGGESFQNLLEFADGFSAEFNFPEDESVKAVYERGGALLFTLHITDVYRISEVRMLLGEANYIGYPMDEGNGNLAGIRGQAIGIGKNCKNEKMAWEFIKTLLGEEFQMGNDWGLPVNRSVLEERLEQAMTPEYDSDGEKTAKSEMMFEGEDSLFIYEITKEDADTLLSLIEKIRYNNSVDYELYNIVMEEADFFFHGERTAEETADIIQHRVSVYMGEKK